MGVLGIVDVAAIRGGEAKDFGRYEPKRKFQWYVDFIPTEGTALAAILGENQLASLKIQIQSAARPNLQMSEIALQHANETWYVAGRNTPTELPMVFYDSLPQTGDDKVDGLESAASILWKWHTTIYDPTTGAIALSRDYKCRVEATLTNPAGDPVERWGYIGLWPKVTDNGNLSYTEDAAGLVNATFRYDKVYRMSVNVTGRSPTSLSETQIDTE